MNRIIQIIIFFLVLISCNKEDVNVTNPESGDSEFISAVDISRYPEISNLNPTFYDLNGNQKDFKYYEKKTGKI